MAEEKAYVGYRSAGRRPESRQDRRAAADAPLSALRGAVSGVLGAPGDIESLIRMLPGLSERTVLPTSEDVEKRLPLPELNRTPTGRAFTTAGQFGGGFYGGPGSPLKVIAESPRIIGRAARDFAQSVSPVHVIKPKGGNWLAGSVERAVEPMKVRVRTEGVNGHTAENVFSDESMNRWLEQKLSKYIKNEMATPEDPLRALADRGVTHIPEGVESLERVTEWIPQTLESRRTAAGFPAEGMSQTPYGQGWEQLTDEAVHNMPARMRVNPDTGKDNPWLMKVPPDTMTYGAYPVEVRQELGFEHLVDELRNAVNPESGLPANLQWKYADLDKVTVPQAVQRVADINTWRAAQKAEADMARANNAAAFTHKEYPEQGYKWVELRQPENLPEGWKEANQSKKTGRANMWYDENNVIQNKHPGEQALSDALKYEGETMGHCVGGYCPDVLEGRSKIYSLRDKKGQPHVTIEVAPGRKLTEKDLPDDVRELLSEQYADASREEFEAAVQQYVKQQAVPDEIVQIKGKGNKAPKAEYLPAVQDFVRSGQWGRVGDLENTGLRRIDPQSDLGSRMREAGVEAPPYVSESELTELLDRYGRTTLPSSPKPTPDAEGFASGGLVEYNPAKIDSIVESLRSEMF